MGVRVMRARLLGLVAAVAVIFTSACAADAASAPAPAWWKPAASAGLSWQIQFTGALDTHVAATVWDVDGEGTTKAQVAALHKAGAKVICYVSAGSYEDWRPDAGQFPASVLGKDLDGWPGEKWLDVRQWAILQPIMKKRFQACAAKGFDAVDPDNMDSYANDNGLGLTAADQLTYDKRIAALAHSLRLGVGLKNDLDQVPALVGAFDFAVNEQCAKYSECARLRPFVAAGKPVFEIEYDVPVTTFCASSRKLGFTAIRKRMSLDAWRQGC
jgi:hypothetical protein